MERWIATITFGSDGIEPSNTNYYSVRAEAHAVAEKYAYYIEPDYGCDVGVEEITPALLSSATSSR